jgi:hypothetical protein
MATDAATQSTDVVRDHDPCVQLRIIGNRLTRGRILDGRATMSTQNNNIVDRQLACMVNPRAAVCAAPAGKAQVREIHDMVVRAQTATVRSVETAQQHAANRYARYRQAACQMIQDQAAGN